MRQILADFFHSHSARLMFLVVEGEAADAGMLILFCADARMPESQNPTYMVKQFRFGHEVSFVRC
jgi:hypothetical protein